MFDMQYANYYNSWRNVCVMLYHSTYCTTISRKPTQKYKWFKISKGNFQC